MSLESEIKQYQISGGIFFRENKKGILGDDCGLGKSIQAIYLTKLVTPKRILVISPKTVKNVWAREVKKWVNEDVVIINGNREERSNLIKGDQKWTVIHYNIIGSKNKYKEVAGEKHVESVDQMHMKELADQKYDLVILDECHRLRNRQSSQFIGAKHIITKCKPTWLVALSATILVNAGSDIWPILHLIDPVKFSSYWKWAKERFEIGNRYNSYAVGDLLNPAKFKEEISPYIIRRLKEDVLKELPKVTYNTIDLVMDSKQQSYYDIMRKKRSIEYRGQVIDGKSAMVVLGKLKQIAVGLETLVEDYDVPLTGSKAEAMMEYLESVGDQKVIFFSQYARAVRCFYHNVVKMFGKDAVAMFTGSDNSEYRLSQEEKLKTDKCKILLTTFGAGGEGSTYTEASIVMFPDLWWNPAVNNQAVGRVDRISQSRPVTVTHFNTLCTAEDRVLSKLDSKQGLFDATIPVTRLNEILENVAEDELSMV